MYLSKTLSKYNNQMIGKIKPIISANAVPPSTNGYLHLARSLALERDKKLVVKV